MLTRTHFVGYDANQRPAGALFQSMLLTSHVLVVGASFTDDNILRLTHEVESFLQRYRSDGEEPVESFGTVLTLSSEALRRRLWQGTLDWHPVHESDDTDAGSRALEVFLDQVAMWACSDQSFLLDERYENLLPDDDRQLARWVRLDASRMAKESACWSGLREALRSFGADR